jgi:hypothetical protein
MNKQASNLKLKMVRDEIKKNKADAFILISIVNRT